MLLIMSKDYLSMSKGCDVIMVCKIDYRLFLFPPWYVYQIISDQRVKSQPRFHEIYFILWILIQWSLILIDETNLLIGFIKANLAIVGFLIANIYLQLDVNKYLITFTTSWTNFTFRTS